MQAGGEAEEATSSVLHEVVTRLLDSIGEVQRDWLAVHNAAFIATAEMRKIYSTINIR